MANKKREKQSEKDFTNPFEITLEIKTDLGELQATYNYEKALDEFEGYFLDMFGKIAINKNAKGYDVRMWMRYVSHADKVLKELIRQVLHDALEQAWFEAKARTLRELNDASYFSRQELPLNNKERFLLTPIQTLSFSLENITDFCNDVADKAYKDARRRMKIDKKGGSKSKLGGYGYAILDDLYKRHLAQAKIILKFYKMKEKEFFRASNQNFSDKKWRQLFFKILFDKKDILIDIEALRQEQEKVESEKEKKDLEKLEKNAYEILFLNDDDKDKWTRTFHKILTLDILFEDLTPENLTYEFLTLQYSIWLKTDFSTGTIENNLKKLRREKKVMLKKSD